MTLLSKSIIRGLRIFSGTFYLLFTLISIPMSFKIGGMHCGLSFTVTLFIAYFLSTTLSILARQSGSRFYIVLTSLIYYCQHLIIASLLYFFLSGFSNDELHRVLKDGTEKIEVLVANQDLMVSESNWLLYCYYYSYVVKPWKFVLSYSTPFFALAEGFFTILAIQAIGETNRWLSDEKNSNSWIISSLLASSGVVTASLYYLYRIYVTPIWELSAQTATLLGCVLSLTFGLGIHGIISERGSVVESSLFFAYIVRCIYEISPKLATTATDEILELFKEVWQEHQGKLPITDNILNYYRSVILKNTEMIWEAFLSKTKQHSNHTLNSFFTAENFWIHFNPLWKFFKNFTISVPFSISELSGMMLQMASESISPAVVVNLCFRVLIFYSATRIIPSLQRKEVRDSRKSRRIMKVLYWYSPCILIAMYTHLILQYSGELKRELYLWGPDSKLSFLVDKEENNIVVDSWSFWNWCNIFWTILIYGGELFGTPTAD
ncbi:hypothetical protein KAFR_0J01330 [Kazachstania africana CBS 2517]|uniref:Protein ICE2 n=1 Tax=Kazachstania africana (strain ATCC 22294 / BCRC 22015 / CBS 2517 / CECT 1963 / NBRC 1671 / NRRL Y-8276) TaxID=1071382 RepID=H2B0Q0_KAZAF|nr:hypothetical protein KAFR_0J01330 [Kazachstania africana CBS 2517]CCF60200.1 hypothetical protein KAFR_0J01330 [Kazachstania africana CBS 2517]